MINKIIKVKWKLQKYNFTIFFFCWNQLKSLNFVLVYFILEKKYFWNYPKLWIAHNHKNITRYNYLCKVNREKAWSDERQNVHSLPMWTNSILLLRKYCTRVSSLIWTKPLSEKRIIKQSKNKISTYLHIGGHTSKGPKNLLNDL